MIDFSQVNYLGVIAATVATMVIGFLWYSPVLFSNAWMKQIGKTKEDLSGGGGSGAYVLTMLTALIGSFVLALLMTLGESNIASGIVIGLLLGIAVSVKIGMNYMFEGRKLGLYLITIGYHLVSFVLSGIIIGAMQG